MATSHPTSPHHLDDNVVILDRLDRRPTVPPPPRLRLLDFVLAALFGVYVLVSIAVGCLFLFLIG